MRIIVCIWICGLCKAYFCFIANYLCVLPNEMFSLSYHSWKTSMTHKASSLYLDKHMLNLFVLHSRVDFIRQRINHIVAFHSYLCNDILNQGIQTTHTHTHTQTHTHKHLYTYTQTNTHIHTNKKHTHKHTHTYTQINTHTNTHTHKHIHTNTHTYKHT